MMDAGRSHNHRSTGQAHLALSPQPLPAPSKKLWPFLGLLLLSSWTIACATPSGSRPELEERIQRVHSEEVGDSPAVMAARERLEGALWREQTAGLVDRLELRLDGIQSNEGALDDKLDLSSRVVFNSPSHLTQLRLARQTESQIAMAELELTSLDERVRRCQQSMNAHARRTLLELYDGHHRQLIQVSQWAQALGAEGFLDDLEVHETLLLAELEIIDGQPISPRGLAWDPYALPSLEVPQNRLRTDHELITELIGRHNPSLTQRRAAAMRYAALAELERVRQDIHLGFFELNYEPMANTGLDALSAQLSVIFPFSRGGASQRLEHLHNSELLEETVLAQRLALIATEALARIELYEERTDAWLNVLSQAERTEAVAIQWLHERRGSPRQILRVLSRVFDARSSSIRERFDAGQAACQLLSTSGLRLEQWPRE